MANETTEKKKTEKKKLEKGRHLSAFKRQRQNAKLRLRNRSLRTSLRTVLKAVRVEPTEKALKVAIPMLDRAVTKGILPRSRASRLVSRLTKLVTKVEA